MEKQVLEENKSKDIENNDNQADTAETVAIKEITPKELHDAISSIEGILSVQQSNDFKVTYLEWIKKLIVDTIKNAKYIATNHELKQMASGEIEYNESRYNHLIEKKKKFKHKKFPSKPHIGDIISVDFGFGYCNELDGQHYGIVLSEYYGNMYLIAPLTSKRPYEDIMPVYSIDTSDLPSKEGIITGYVLFNQIGFRHIRRMEVVGRNYRGKVKPEDLKEIVKIYKEMF